MEKCGAQSSVSARLGYDNNGRLIRTREGDLRTPFKNLPQDNTAISYSDRTATCASTRVSIRLRLVYPTRPRLLDIPRGPAHPYSLCPYARHAAFNERGCPSDLVSMLTNPALRERTANGRKTRALRRQIECYTRRNLVTKELPPGIIPMYARISRTNDRRSAEEGWIQQKALAFFFSRMRDPQVPYYTS